MNRVLLSTLFFIISIVVCAQPSSGVISGYLSSKGKALEGAKVILLNTQKSVVTDSIGYFELKLIAPGKYTIQASDPSYRNFEMEVIVEPGKIIRIDTILQQLTANFNDVIVTENLLRTSKSPVIDAVDIITTKEFERNPGNNVFDALTNAKGIFCDVDQGLTNPVDININGLEGSFSLFTIDGVPAMNNLAGIFALCTFPVSMVDNIQIEKGSNSTVYGSDAMSGIINIVTKDPSTAPKLVINTMFDSKLESELGLTAAFHLRKVNTVFSISTNNMNYRWDINHDNFMDVPLINRACVFNKWTFIRKEMRLAVIYARYLFEDRFVGQMNIPGRLTGSNQYYSHWLGTNQWQAGFQYQLPCREKFILLADYSEHYQQAHFDTISYHGLLRNVYTQLNWNKNLGKHSLSSGVSYRLRYYKDNSGLSDVTLTGIGNCVNSASVFIQDQISVNPNDEVFLGFRFDYSNLSGPVAAPRICYKWNSSDLHNIIRLVAGTGYRVPNVLNEGFTALETSRQVIVPQKLKTEYSVSLNVDYSYKHFFHAGTLKLETGVFGIYLVNFVEPDYLTEPSSVIYRNSQGGGAFGGSVSIDWAFKFPLELGFNCTYSYAYELDRDTAMDEIELETPTHSPFFSGNFYAAYTFTKQQLRIDLTGDFVSPMKLATVPNDFRLSHSPWFSILNIQVSKKFKKGIELFAGVKNLLNFVQQNPILRPADPFNRYVGINNPNGYRFDTNYAYSTIEGIKGFIGFRYTLL